MRFTCVVDIINHFHCCGVSMTSVCFPSAVDEHLDYSHSGAIKNSVSRNILEHISWSTCGYIQSGISGSQRIQLG